MMGIRAIGLPMYDARSKPRTKIQNDRPSAIAYGDCSAHAPARKRGVSRKTFPPAKPSRPKGIKGRFCKSRATRQGRCWIASCGRTRSENGSAHRGTSESERYRHHAVAVIGSKAVPSRHIACKMTASFRAQANHGTLEASPILELQAPAARAAFGLRTRVSNIAAAS